eukprot:TRINITY_DN1119_c0_g1_i1.p2 TRINITY_DN1119_c0_g1~~TRINITY_DN1119_c0_g1_i1.p2  ORF type:complete len:60 (+),score=4.61 TRINITY_DN1119_c0_g1_i1:373-552(+)
MHEKACSRLGALRAVTLTRRLPIVGRPVDPTKCPKVKMPQCHNAKTHTRIRREIPRTLR